jgi:hypothetical protein
MCLPSIAFSLTDVNGVKIDLCQSVKIYAHDTPYANSWKTAGHFLDFTSLHAESVI